MNPFALLEAGRMIDAIGPPAGFHKKIGNSLVCQGGGKPASSILVKRLGTLPTWPSATNC